VKPPTRLPYNDRLFRSGLRRRHHLARFEWVNRTLRRLDCPSDAVLEIGCFDGKLLDHLPRVPQRYKGFDANWEGGLDLALMTRGNAPGREFLKAARAEEMRLEPSERFDVAVSLETLEHVPPDEVEPYLRTVAGHLDGYLLITVPNEIGAVFLLKWALKKVGFSGGRERYSFAEVMWAFLGQTRRIRRREHKGFDYRDLAGQVGEHFEVVSVEGFPLGRLPPRFCLGIGIVARSRASGAG
jgi:SAM-dependent methyltransferase